MYCTCQSTCKSRTQYSRGHIQCASIVDTTHTQIHTTHTQIHTSGWNISHSLHTNGFGNNTHCIKVPYVFLTIKLNFNDALIPLFAKQSNTYPLAENWPTPGQYTDTLQLRHYVQKPAFSNAACTACCTGLLQRLCRRRSLVTCVRVDKSCQNTNTHNTYKNSQLNFLDLR